MALPTATVKIEVLKLTAVPAVTLAAGHTRYARGTFRAGSAATVQTGRSRPIPDAGGAFDVAGERSPWLYEVSVAAGSDISATIELWEDHGDDDPPARVTFKVTIKDPWKSGTFSASDIEYRVDTKLVNPTDAAFLARAAKAAGISGTLKIPQAFAVEITDIDGLYQPDPAAVIPNPGAKKMKGYLSEDSLGRIFTNRKPDGSWSKDEQYIEVSATVTAIGLSTVPAAAKVKWTVADVDDPTNDAPDFHNDWGPYVDQNDYNASKVPTGAAPGDNALAYSDGNADEALLFGAAVKAPPARWAVATGGPAVSPISRTEAESSLVRVNPTSATTKIRIHGTNVLGTNLVVRATLNGVPLGIPVHGAFTGVMTMWSRIDVEVKRMQHAHSIKGALSLIRARFHGACVQLDLQEEVDVTGVLDKLDMAANDDLVPDGSVAWVNTSSVFSKRGQPGWFFLGAACRPNPLPSTSPKPLVNKVDTFSIGVENAGGKEYGTVETPGDFPGADYLEFEWTVGADQLKAGFPIWRAEVTSGKTKMFLRANDVTQQFTGHDSDGSLAHAMKTQVLFFPRHQRPDSASTLSAGGFDVPAPGAKLTVYPAGAVATSGISPSVPSSVTGTGEYFAGRTILFTHHPKFSTRGASPAPLADFDARVIQTVIHEFLHAFGMPHKCGYWAWRTPRKVPKGRSCCMNYFNTWLLDAAGKPIPGSAGNQGDDMCGRHLMEVRRVHLERNAGLNW